MAWRPSPARRGPRPTSASTSTAREGRISVGIPFNIPPDRPTEIFVTAGGDPPVAPATETLTFQTADPYTVEAERFAEAILDDLPMPVEPHDAVANLRVIEAIFAAAGGEPAD